MFRSVASINRKGDCMQKIHLLLDYKGMFGSRQDGVPYRSGMDKDLLKKYFIEKGYDVKYLSFCDVNLRTMDFKNQHILYTSSEDNGSRYKKYIEDICYALQLQGGILIPEYKHLLAHNNKVFMEFLRDLSGLESVKNIKSYHFGTIEELNKKKELYNGKHVIKGAEGACSSQVYLANNQYELLKLAAKISKSRDICYEIWDVGRSFKHRGYIRESKYRNKFITQNFINKLSNDWKILIYGNKYYILYRSTRENDFRASGSGHFLFKEEVPNGILDFAESVFYSFNVPNLSIDVAFDGENFYLLEFQSVYFGTLTIEHSPFYFAKENSQWIMYNEHSSLEKEFVNSVSLYIKNNIKQVR
jgi:glutathione synthase/RimK-type ligase-like ATP-grasp enzyme